MWLATWGSNVACLNGPTQVEASGKEGKMLKMRGTRADLHMDMLMRFATANDLVMILTWFTYYYFCDSFFSLMTKKINLFTLAQSSAQRCVRCAFSSAFVTPWDLNSPWGEFQFRFAPWHHKRRAEQALSYCLRKWRTAPPLKARALLSGSPTVLRL